MKTLFTFVVLFVLGFLALSPAVVAAEEMQCPGHDMDTVQSLGMCVEHALAMGAITNQGVASSLLAKVDAAQEAVDRGQTAVAALILQALINEVRAQSGVHIEAGHAQHLIAHAQRVIDALE